MLFRSTLGSARTRWTSSLPFGAWQFPSSYWPTSSWVAGDLDDLHFVWIGREIVAYLRGQKTLVDSYPNEELNLKTAKAGVIAVSNGNWYAAQMKARVVAVLMRSLESDQQRRKSTITDGREGNAQTNADDGCTAPRQPSVKPDRGIFSGQTISIARCNATSWPARSVAMDGRTST